MRAGDTRSTFRLWRAQRGSVAVHIGLMAIAIIGMAALGSEIVFLLYKHREMQSAADAAAFSSSTALTKGFPSDLNVEARAIAAEAGFVNGVGGTTVTLNHPPLSGALAGNSQGVEVIVAQPQTLYMVSLFVSGIFNVGARAVAQIGTGNGCVLQLLASRNPGVNISNGAVVTLTQCGLVADATGAQALKVTGAAVLNAQSVSVSGQTEITNGATINATNGVKNSQPPVADPYAGVVMPVMPGGCTFTTKTYAHSATTQTLTPGSVFCNGLAFTNDAIINMPAGVYFIDRGAFAIGGATKVTATGVTIVLTSSTGTGYAWTTIGNGANVTISAPTTGATAGIVFFGDRRAPITTSANDFGGGAAINFTGAIYLPTVRVTFSNGLTNPSGCTNLVAGDIVFTGAANFKNNCPTGVKAIGSSTSTLVE
jgi:hypothetical protein